MASPKTGTKTCFWEGQAFRTQAALLISHLACVPGRIDFCRVKLRPPRLPLLAALLSTAYSPLPEVNDAMTAPITPAPKLTPRDRSTRGKRSNAKQLYGRRRSKGTGSGGIEVRVDTATAGTGQGRVDLLETPEISSPALPGNSGLVETDGLGVGAGALSGSGSATGGSAGAA